MSQFLTDGSHVKKEISWRSCKSESTPSLNGHFNLLPKAEIPLEDVFSVTLLILIVSSNFLASERDSRNWKYCFLIESRIAVSLVLDFTLKPSMVSPLVNPIGSGITARCLYGFSNSKKYLEVPARARSMARNRTSLVVAKDRPSRGARQVGPGGSSNGRRGIVGP